jgi:hypothetical protein
MSYAGVVEFIDCSTVSITYDATGKASVSFTVVKNTTDDLSNLYTRVTFANRTFTGSLMSVVKRPIFGSDGWCEWQLQLQGVGN